MNTAIKQTKSFKFASNVIGRDICSTDELTSKDYYALIRFFFKDKLGEVMEA
ncbi:hypothetical protein [Clostridium sp. BJN0013]|uniref:hypothetical protein n=1 Tax=Clostridium sp. BJN0013 TaxID=3236840 RepID=UPI0034C69084